jgi:hypothetical protein
VKVFRSWLGYCPLHAFDNDLCTRDCVPLRDAMLRLNKDYSALWAARANGVPPATTERLQQRGHIFTRENKSRLFLSQTGGAV